MKLSPILFFIAIAVSFLSCGNQGPGGTEVQVPEGYEGFAEFYERFHEDSAYQMEHIIFPLEGLPREADSSLIASGAFRWQKEDWAVQRGFSLQGSSFEKQLIPLGEGLIIEKITHKAGDLGMQRRFARIGDDWYLIYYADLNRMREKGSINIDGGF